ncbi:sigma-70 family RNA polymerase sigma factor [Brevibacillus reuszeri]|uniref:sigma-70 family RNA polymerase sigma factor n=1 Tax=Brevibacillus reuszeri TaxID=54915 RepID=UPI0028A0960A|nr:sigma-70 family RNA polymerase sigma factor [Brevibacillus reuszeri]
MQRDHDVNELVKQNLHIVQYIVKKYFPPQGYDYDDLFQIGCVGLVIAAQKFDPSKGNFLNTASIHIRHEFQAFFRKIYTKKRTAEVLSLDYTHGENDTTYMDMFSSSECVDEEVEAKLLLEDMAIHEPKIMTLAIQGYSHREIGKILGLRKAALKERVQKLRHHTALSI